MNKAGAYILIKVDIGKSYSVLKAIQDVPETVYSHIVTGPYDIIAYLESKKHEELTSLVAKKIHDISGITRTMTCFTVSS